MRLYQHAISLALGFMWTGVAACAAESAGEMSQPNTCYLSSFDTEGSLACFDQRRQPLSPTLVGVDLEGSSSGIKLLNLELAIKGAGSPDTAFGEYNLRVDDEMVEGLFISIVLYPLNSDFHLIANIARAARGGGGAVHRGGGAVHRSGTVYRGGAVVRRGAVATGAAYYGGAACGYYPYPPCGSAYYGGGAAYRGGAVYRGGGAVYRGGGAVHRGGRGAHVSHHRGGGRRR